MKGHIFGQILKPYYKDAFFQGIVTTCDTSLSIISKARSFVRPRVDSHRIRKMSQQHRIQKTQKKLISKSIWDQNLIERLDDSKHKMTLYMENNNLLFKKKKKKRSTEKHEQSFQQEQDNKKHKQLNNITSKLLHQQS